MCCLCRRVVSKAGNPWKKLVYVWITEEQYPRISLFSILSVDKVDQ